MATTGQPTLGFRPGDGSGPIEVVRLAELVARATALTHAARHRTGFHALLWVESGQGRHEVDYAEHPLDPGTLLWVRPGAVQRFTGTAGLDGLTVLFTPSAPAPDPDPALADALRLTSRSTTWRLRDDSLVPVTATALQTVTAGAARHVLTGLLLELLARPAVSSHPLGPADEVFLRFEEYVERHLSAGLAVQRIARDLGWSARTLSRSCARATGRTAKEFVAQRLLLEAQRLLGSGTGPVAAVGRDLGFEDAAHFGRFFTRHTGVPPGVWRAGLASTAD